MLIDYVFPYVNSSDIVWQRTYNKFCEDNKIKENQFGNEKARFRDFGDLVRFTFRSIAKNMPWINNIFFIVQSESQVPEWLDRSKVKIIYHDQFIPARYLPTYNSTTIEMFLWNIPELNEHFIYGNDDLFALNYCSESDFYSDTGLPKAHLKVKSKVFNMNAFRQTIVNGQDLILKDFPDKAPPKEAFYRTGHLMSPFLKSIVKKVWNRHRIEIGNNITNFRSDKNVNQYIYTFYQVFSGQYIDEVFNGKYMDTQMLSIDEICNILLTSNYKTVCINDSGLNNEKECVQIYNTLNKIFSKKCKYEYEQASNTVDLRFDVNNSLSKFGFVRDTLDISEIRSNNYVIKYIPDHKYPWLINISNLNYSECFSDTETIIKDLNNIQSRFKPILDVINDLEKTNILSSANNLNLTYNEFSIIKEDDIFINTNNKKYLLDDIHLANNTIIEILDKISKVIL